LEEGGIRVPLIFRWPGVLPKGTEFSEPIHAMDLTATIAAVGGASHRADQPFDGMNVLPALKGERELPSNRTFFFRRFKGRIGHYQQSAVRQGDWKYLRRYRGSEKYTEALYNLRSDIGETKDLAKSAPEKLSALRRLLEKWELEMSKTAAPLKKK
jgi:arylsulfatase A-like enzyme